MDYSANGNRDLELLIESCKPAKKRGRPSHKRQLQEIREEKVINLQTPDSVIVATNLKSILTLQTMQTLPLESQQQLIKLLPEFDQIDSDDPSKLNKNVLNNEYFAKFCEQYLEKLSDNRLSVEAIEQAKADTNRDLSKLDPWKLKNYEPIWGQKLISQIMTNDEEEDSRIERMMSSMRKQRLLQKQQQSRSVKNDIKQSDSAATSSTTPAKPVPVEPATPASTNSNGRKRPIRERSSSARGRIKR